MMNQEDLFKKIGHILSELQEQYQYIAEHPQNLNGLEVELMLSNANFLTDHIQIVRKTLNHQELKAIPQQTETSPKPTPQEINVQLVLSEEPVQNRFEFEEKQVDQLFNRPLTVEEQEIIAKKQQLNVPVESLPDAPAPEVKAAEPYIIITPEPEPVKPVVEQSPVVEQRPVIEEIPVFVEEVPVAEEPPLVIPTAPMVENSIPEKAAKPTLNELLANNRQATEKTDYPAAEIKDLKQAISLNDKLLFVKDLFHGYSLAYAEVIDLLNKMPDFKSADAFLQHNYAVKNDWKNKQDTVDRFYQLLKRRFPAK
jgi:hypothetical protein